MSKIYDLDKTIHAIWHEEPSEHLWGYRPTMAAEIARIFESGDPQEIDKDFEEWGKCYFWIARVIRKHKDQLMVEE